jgi:hypothetical protein
MPKHLCTSLLALTFGLAACSTPAAPPPALPDRHDAPVVIAPRNVASFAPAPCAGPLPPSALRDLGFDGPGRPTRLATGANSCTWEDYGSEQALSLTIYPGRDILVDTYRTRLFAIFMPFEVDRLPAVAERSSTDATACTLTVGTAPDQGFVATYTQLEVAAGERPDDPCGRGKRIVERIVAALPPLPGS